MIFYTDLERIGEAIKNSKQQDSLKNDLEMNNTNKPKLLKKSRIFRFKSGLIPEECENCTGFILGPSIFCMLMSLKYGLIWLLNIVFAILTLYNDSLIEIRR